MADPTRKASCAIRPQHLIRLYLVPLPSSSLLGNSAYVKKQQTLDPAAEGRLARALFPHAFMSDTKWRKMILAVSREIDRIDRMSVKFIDVSEPKLMRFPPSLQCPDAYMDTLEFGPVALRSIEWMEFARDLTDVLNPLGRFALEVYDERTRIIGYRR